MGMGEHYGGAGVGGGWGVRHRGGRGIWRPPAPYRESVPPIGPPQFGNFSTANVVAQVRLLSLWFHASSLSPRAQKRCDSASRAM
jgi:hypothetical protein